MSITKLRISNFKGVDKEATFDIRPITLFLGPNSSGKSSCIHALAALAQTVKLPNSGRPLVLDDEYAQVHLGRFIEVIHSKNYSDSISIGFDTALALRGAKGKTSRTQLTGSFSVDYEFKSTRRTQDIYLESLQYKTSELDLSFKANANKTAYAVQYNGKPLQGTFAATNTLRPAISPASIDSRNDFSSYLHNEECARVAIRELAQVLYLGPFRQSPLRRYPTRGSSPTEVGAQGESTITLLANEHVQTKTRPHIRELSKWLSDLGLAKKVQVSRLGTSDLFDIRVELADGATLPIADLGYGMSQVLPVLAQCSFAQDGATLLFEQPELHLHSSSAEKMAGVFVQVTKTKKVSIIAETHSRELLIGLLDEIREGRLALSDLAVYTVTRRDRHSEFSRLEIEQDEDGRPECYDPWQNIL